MCNRVQSFCNFARGWLSINHEISEGDKSLSSGYSASSSSEGAVTDAGAADGSGVGHGADSTGAGLDWRRRCRSQTELRLIPSVMSATSIRRESFRMQTV